MSAPADAPAGTSAIPRGPWEVAADLGLLALALGTTVGLNRLFLGWDFLAALTPLVALAWFVAVLLRRVARWSVPVSLAAHLALGVVVLVVRFAPGTHLAGIPTGRTLEVLREAIDTSFGDFAQLVAPVPVSDGFLVVLAAALWVFAFFADTAAMRYRGVVQAAVPHTAVFLALGILARGSGRWAATLWFGVGAAAYAVTQVGLGATERRWIEGSPRRGAVAAASSAAALGVAALVGALVITPLLPGGTEPVIDLREIGRGQGPRTVVSPFVGLGSLLGPRSSEVLFTVDAAEPAYWRLTALERFDEERQLWVSSGKYSNADGVLPPTDSIQVSGHRLTQEVTITGLAGLWLPGAYVPERIETDASVSFDQRSASIILDEAEDDVTYRLDSVVPDFGSVVRADPSGSAEPVDPVHLTAPELSTTALRALGDVTTPQGDGHRQMTMLQNWFRAHFSYDESVDYSRDDDPLGAFLTERRGFCQQFSSAFAQIARWLGMPSRVAVGFTPGDGAPLDELDEDGRALVRYTVRGRHAHAWPEIYFEGVGWVPFEPTPQRGDPQSVSHTGVAPEQAEQPELEATTTTAPRTDTPDVGEEQPDATATTTSAPGSQIDAGSRSSSTGDGVPVWVGVALLAVAGAAVAVVLVRRRRRAVDERSRPDDPDRAAVVAAWADAVAALRPLHVTPEPTETPTELVGRVRRSLDRADPDGADHDGDDRTDSIAPVVGRLTELADAVTSARYRANPPTSAEVARANALVPELRDAVRSLSRPGTGGGSDREPVSQRR